MRIALVQLSDLHLRPGVNPVMPKVPKIADAIRATESAADAYIIALTGDIANSGDDREYVVAKQLLEDLQSALLASFSRNAPVYIVAIPGNHDCDLSGDQAARDTIRTSIAAGPSVGSSIVSVCTEVQRSFFDLRDVLSSAGHQAKGNRLYYEYRLPVGDTLVEVRCLNTAWLSAIREVQGTLYFPVDEVAGPNPQARLTVTLLHHPFGWFASGNRRDLQLRIEQTSDIILTGHEHAHSRRTQTVSTGETNEFIEGAALQDHSDENESSFNVLLLDLDQRRQQFARYEWSGSMYEPVGQPRWEEYQANRLRARGDFVVRSEFNKHIEDVGATFEKPGYGTPLLSELFVFPELRLMSAQHGALAPTCRSEEVLEESVDTPHLVITGAEQSGKTSLAKITFQQLGRKGFVPLLVEGRQLTTGNIDKLRQILYAHFGQQYEGDDLEKYRQLDRLRRVLIIDDFHDCQPRRGEAETLLRHLAEFAGRVILVTNDLAYSLGEMTRAGRLLEERPGFRHYRILPLGHAKRHELTTKWLLLGGQLDDERLARQLMHAEEVMEVILGKNFVPAFPIFVLAMLQGLDTNANVDTSASTYGYFYEILIRDTLARGSNKTQYDILLSFLGFLAYAMFVSGRRELTLPELEEVHQQFADKYDIALDRRALEAELRKKLVLIQVSDTVEFKYQYFYYYFVASYLRDHIGEEAVVEWIKKVSANVADEDNANVLIFLAHLSRDPLVISEILANAERHFEGIEPAKLEEDVAFVGKLAPAAIEIDYEDRSFEENRRQAAERRDQAERDRPVVATRAAPGPDGRDAVVKQQIARVVAALKTMQILGQILKNFPGSLEARLKERIARSCYELGFRTLSNVLGFLREDKEQIVAAVMTAIREDRPSLQEAEFQRRANAVVFGLAVGATYGVLKRISFAVGSRELIPTYNKIQVAMPTTAVELVNMSIKLDQFDGFPRGEIVRLGKELEQSPLARNVLGWMVVAHVNLFPVPFHEKQRAFAALQIRFAGAPGSALDRRLLAPRAREPKDGK